MKKKIMSIIVGAMLVSAIGASASEPEIKIEGRTINITAKTDADKTAMLIVSKYNSDINNNDNVYAVKEAKADSDGILKFVFSMPDDESSRYWEGKYNVSVKPESSEMQTNTFTYVSSAKVESLMSRIKSAIKDQTDYKELHSVLSNDENSLILETIGFDVSTYVSELLEKSEDVSKFAFSFLSEEENLTDSEILSGINLAIDVCAINKDESTASEKYIKNNGLTFEEVKFDDITDSKRREWIVSYIYGNRSYTSIDDFENTYKRANMFYVINNARFTEMEEILGKYADSLGIKSDSRYIKYSNLSDKAKTNQNIVNLLSASKASDKESLLNIISRAIPQNSTGGGGGSSSGGGSGSTGSGHAVPVVDSSSSNSGSENRFPDIAHLDWAKKAINSLAEKGIIDGDEKGNFNPDALINREEFLKMLVLATNKYDENAKCEFIDVPDNSWFYSYVASAFEKNLVNGVTDAKFGTGEKITRQDMAVMCYRAAKDLLKNVKESKKFGDAEIISDYATEAVEALYRAGIISGMDNDTFAPNENATRAQCAVIIYNLIEN